MQNIYYCIHPPIDPHTNELKGCNANNTVKGKFQ